MKPVRFPFGGAYFDPSGQGFALAQPPGITTPPSRQRLIVAVCWNQADDRAFFINGAGLAVPSEHNRYELAPLLWRRAVRIEYGVVIGQGQFAMKAAELKTLKDSGRFKQWITVHLEQPRGWLDDPAAWAAYLAADLDAEQAGVMSGRRVAEELSSRCQGIALPFDQGHPSAPRMEAHDAIRQAVEERRAERENWRRNALAADARLGAWLRGEVGAPPLLALMEGKAR